MTALRRVANCYVTDGGMVVVPAKVLRATSLVVLEHSTRPSLVQERRKYKRLMVLPGRPAWRSEKVGRTMESCTVAPDDKTGPWKDDFQWKARRC